MRRLKRFELNLRHQVISKRVLRLGVSLRFAKKSDSGFSRNALIAFVFAILLTALPATAQDQASIFKNYDDMRARLDRMMLSRDIADVMLAFGASDEMTQEELDDLETRVRSIFSSDFDHVDVLKRDDMGNGWARELYAYWGDSGYLYATVLMHKRPEVLVAIEFKFNTDIDDLIGAF